jgi:DNA-binding CsgD family transcriptional regulator
MEYLEHFQVLDPYVIRGPGLKSPNQAIRFSDVADIATVWKGEFGSFMQRVPYYHALALVPLIKGVPLGVFSIHRRRNQRDFDSVEQERFRAYFQHVAKGIEYRRLCIERGAVPLAQSAVICRTGRILAMGEEMRETLVRLPSGRHYEIPSPAERPRLWRIGTDLFVARSVALPPHSLWNTPWVIRHRRDASLDRLGAKLRMSAGIRENRLAVMIEPLDRDPQALVEITGVRFSPQESRVALLLLKGFGTERIAEVMDISPLTVSGHIKHCHRKVGVHLRREFLAKFLG